MDLAGATTTDNRPMKSKYGRSKGTNETKATHPEVQVVRRALAADGAPILRNEEIIRKLRPQPIHSAIQDPAYSSLKSLNE